MLDVVGDSGDLIRVIAQRVVAVLCLECVDVH